MNVFVILLAAVLMMGYFFLDAPSVSMPGESRTEAMEVAELKAVLGCVLYAHTEAVRLDRNGMSEHNAINLPCAEKYDITTRKICSDGSRVVSECVSERADRAIFNHIITKTDIITENGAGKILEILATDFANVSNIGIIYVKDRVPYILSSGGVTREISRAITKEADFKDGELAYITQYSVSYAASPRIINQVEKVHCASGQTAVYRQNKWSCVDSNVQRICSGDYIWDADLMECVVDKNKKPFCPSNLSAVMIDDVWDCIPAENQQDCPTGFMATMDYETMTWDCVPMIPKEEDKVKKCDKIYDRVYGGGMTTVRGSLVSCNDCEKMIVHDDCTAECVPDATATSKPSCYAGSCQYFYFGFPDAKYIQGAKKNITALNGVEIPVGTPFSRNRKFNCIECPYGVDELASSPPYVIVCND